MKIITTNKRAFHDYEILETMEAGIALTGDEIKSIRAKMVSINDAYATVHDGQATLINASVTPYSNAFNKEDTARRSRILLLHRREINRLIGAISRKGLTVVPLKMYFNDRGYVKLELGLAKHKKAVDKKRDIRERDIERETRRDSKIRLR